MKTYLITGANRGIGLALAKKLHAHNEQVIATCRKSSSKLEKLGVKIIDGINVTEQSSIDRLKELKNIDVLVLNAGILSYESLSDLNIETIRQQFEVNALAPLRITQAMLSSLAPNAKVIIITSRMGSIEDNTSGGYYGYRMSKAAVNMAAMSLTRDLRGRGIAVRVIHPGLVATRMTGMTGISAKESANGILDRIKETNIATTGEFWHANGEQLPW